MKKVSLLIQLVLLAALVFSCLPEDPILLEDTAYITISFQHPKDSFPANEEILLKVAAYRKDNALVTQDPSVFDFYDGNGNKLLSDTLTHAMPGAFSVYANLKDIQSNPLDYKIYDKDKPARLTLSFYAARDSFLTKENIILKAAAYRQDSSLITSRLSDFQLQDHTGQILNSPLKHQDEGDYFIYAVYKNQNSPVLSYQVHDRNKLVDSIHLQADFYTFIADGKTQVNFNVNTYIRGNPIDDIDYTITANDQPIENAFKTTQPGPYSISTTVANKTSNRIALTAKPAKTYAVTEIPVIFHIIHDGEAIGNGYNIPRTTIEHELHKLNITFRKLSGSMGDNKNPAGVDAQIQFVLAESDPSGARLPESGINRVQRPGTSHSIKFWQEDWMWDVFWDPDYYINIWVGDTKDQYSWGSLPQTYCPYPLAGMGCTDYPEVYYKQGIAYNKEHISNTSTVLSHEMGHVLGLGHVFDQSISCRQDPDYCDDTPYYDRIAYESNIATYQQKRISCQGIQYRADNYMDYYYGANNTFTYEQRERMQHIVRHGRWRGLKAASQKNGRQQPQQIRRPAEEVDMSHLIVW